MINAPVALRWYNKASIISENIFPGQSSAVTVQAFTFIDHLKCSIVSFSLIVKSSGLVRQLHYFAVSSRRFNTASSPRLPPPVSATSCSIALGSTVSVCITASELMI